MTTRRLAAILAADMVGYSRLMGADEEGTLARLQALRREVIDPCVSASGGRVVKSTGDGILAEFPSAVEAVRCALAMQEQTGKHEAGGAAEQRIAFRIGINVGDVIATDEDIHGDGVNVAARLEALAEPGGILVSANAHAMAAGRLQCVFEDIGERVLKNIAQPVRAYRVKPAPQPAERPALALPDKPSLVVLPFQNMSGDPEQEYFVDGLVDDITTALSRVGGLFVIARNSAFTYKGRAVDVRQVGRELGVSYVLEGSIRKSASRVRITVQLVEAAIGGHVWADRFDGDLADIFDLQDRITESVVGALEPNLQRAEIARASAKPTEGLNAYDLYLRALSHFHAFTRERRELAADLLDHAIRLDGGYSRAKALLAFLSVLPIGSATPETVARSVRLAEEAVAADRDDPNTLAMAGVVLGYAGVSIEAAIGAVDRAMALNAASALVLRNAGVVYLWAGNSSLAIDFLIRALRLSPLDPETSLLLNALGWAYLHVRRDEDAHATMLRAIRERPNGTALRGLIVSLIRLGRTEEARGVAEELMRLEPGYRISTNRLVYRDQAFVQDQQKALRLAGLPE